MEPEEHDVFHRLSVSCFSQDIVAVLANMTKRHFYKSYFCFNTNKLFCITLSLTNLRSALQGKEMGNDEGKCK